MNNSDKTLRKAHKLLSKITKKMHRPELYFSVQIGTNSERVATETTYTAMIAPPLEGFEPIYFADKDGDLFIQKIQFFLDEKISEEELKKAWHEYQIDANKRSIEIHEKELESIKNGTNKEDKEE